MNPALDLFKSVGGALLALALVAVIGWVAITRIRAWMRQPDDIDEGFTLADLRRLHREGQLSDEEFERAQEQIIAVVRSKPSKKDVPKTKGGLAPKSRAAEPPNADEMLDLLEEPGHSTPPMRAPRVRPDASGRIVIRDDTGGGAPEGPPPTERPKKPSDPRTGPRET